VTGRDLSPTGEPAGTGARKAFERGLAAIRRRERGTAELAEWLAARDFTPTDVNTAIAHLTEVGELDDRRFAKRFAEDKRELRGWGAERIREGLMRRGIASELIESALGAEGHDAELARAEGLLARRAQPLGSDAERRRALAFLARRGYDLDLAYEAIRRGGREAA
jgi:regulatory protein